jgi:hypothetical protein
MITFAPPFGPMSWARSSAYSTSVFFYSWQVSGLPSFHYTFAHPYGYIGWVQAIFNDPQAASLAWRNSAYKIDVPEPGVPAILCA